MDDMDAGATCSACGGSGAHPVAGMTSNSGNATGAFMATCSMCRGTGQAIADDMLMQEGFQNPNATPWEGR